MIATKPWQFSILFSLQILATCAFGQSSYFVSSAGSDGNNGKSTSTPWQTITKVNSVNFVSGDAIYFRGGETFFGQINVNQSGVTIGAYEVGTQKPVITGAIQLSGWTVYSGSIYVAQASSLVNNLYANGLQMTLARYPNSGFIYITSKSSNTIFDASGVTQTSGYWNGANCRLRTNGWTFESPTVSSQSGTTIVLSSAPRFNTFEEGWGFYLDNKLAALDTPGEWFCDPANNKVYFYAPGGVNPNTLIVYGSTLDYGITSYGSYITVRDLEFHYQSKAGMNLTGRNASLFSNTVYGGLADGINVSGINCTIDGNIIQNVNGNGIHIIFSAKTCIVSNNTIKSIGLIKGYQSAASAYGILSEGTYATISGNYIDGVGYDGIYAFSHDLVERNVIKNTMLALADGGAIYIGSGSSNVTIQNNFISDVYGDNEATGLWGGPHQNWTAANGIYMDGGSSNSIAKDNTIIRARSNAFMVNYNTYNHTITNNTAYDCASNPGGYYLFIDLNTSLNYGGHSITKNIFYPAASNQKLVQIQDFSSVVHSPGIVDNNYYLNPHGNSKPFETQLNNSGNWWIATYTFDGWNALTGLDLNSKYIIPESDKGDTIIVNSTAYPMTVNLPSITYYNLDNTIVERSFTLAPFSSKVLIKDFIAVNSAITVSPPSILFGNVALNTSVEQTYTLSGSNLIPADDSLTIEAPIGFTISTVSGSDYTSSKRIAYTGGTLPAKTIYVKFTPTEVSGYGIYITNSGGGAAVNSVEVRGMGVSTTTPTLTVNPASLPFGNVIINTSSSERTFTLTGSNLSPGGDITITAPTGYQVSTVSGSGFSPSVNFSYSGATLSSKTIYVKFSPAAVRDYMGNIVCTAGSLTKNVAVTGSGFISNSPVIAVGPGSLAFSTVLIGTSSSERIYTLQGSYLTPASGNIVLTAPTGYEVSLTSKMDFSSSLNVPYTGSTLSAITVYVRFSPTVEQTYADNITNAGGGAQTQSVAVSGRGISSTSAAITVNPTSLSFRDVVINTTSSELSYELTAINLSPSSDSLTITASDGFTISNKSGSGFASTKRIAYANKTLIAYPINVKFSPTAEQSYYGVITCSGGGAGEQTISVNGNGINQQPPSLTVDPVSLSFGNVTNNTVSGGRYYTLTGSNLIPASGSIIIEATAGFEVSLISGMNFNSRDTIEYTDGKLSANIYTRFLPTFLGSYNGNILNTGGGATIAVPVSGSGVESRITVNPASLPFSSVVINNASSERSFTITASSLTPESGDIVLTVPSAAFQVSSVSGSGFGSSVQIPYSGGAITTPKTIFVKFLPTAEQSYSGNITIKVDNIAAQDVSVNGLGISSSAPLITIDPTSLLFENVQVNMASSTKTYTLTGVNLSPANGNVTVTAPAGFQVSAAIGTDFNTSLTIPYSGGIISASSIYVRFYPEAEQNYAGNIANTGGNAAAESVYVSGSSLIPSLIFSSDSLPFGSVIINTSSVKTYTLSGSNLRPANDTVKITTPIGFTVSTRIDSGFNSSVSIPYTANSLYSIPIYVRFTPSAMQSYRGNVTHFCGGAVIQNLPVSGESAIPSLTVNPPLVNFGNVRINTTSTELTYRIHGSYLTPASGNIIVNAPYNFEVSVTSGSGFNSSVNIPYINSTLSSTVIYIRFFPSAVSNFTGNISNDGGGATTQSVGVNGTGVNAVSLFVDVDSLSFGSIIINSLSSEKYYSLSGSNLAANGAITVTSSKGFQVSKTSGAGFDTTISIPYSGDSLSSRYIYVRFSPASVENYIGTITNAGIGIPAINVAVSGACLPPNQIVLLGQNFPNPFNPTTRIPYSVHKKSWVKLTIFNMLGQRIRILIDEEQDAGYYQPEFNVSRDNNGQELSSGVYFYRLEIAGISATKKLILLK